MQIPWIQRILLKKNLHHHCVLALQAIESQIHEAVEVGEFDRVKELLATGISPNAVQHEGKKITPLHIASGYCNLEIVKLLLKSGANVNVYDEMGETPLHYAVQGTFLPNDEKDQWDERENETVQNMLSVLEVLAANGAKTNAKTNYGGATPLNMARLFEIDKIENVLRKYGKTKGIDWRYSTKEFLKGVVIIGLCLSFVLGLFFVGLIIKLIIDIF